MDEIDAALVGAEIDIDIDRVKLLLSEVEGKDITEIIASGMEKLASVPAGSGGGVAMSTSGGGVAMSAGGGGAAPAAAEAKKEEKEESDDDMGFRLFD